MSISQHGVLCNKKVLSLFQDRMMSSAFSNPGAQGGHFYSSSSVMSYSHNGDGEPKIYQATSSVTQGPGGVSSGEWFVLYVS